MEKESKKELTFKTHRMKGIGREERDAREREGEREIVHVALGPVSDLFQTCFRPLQKDHLIFAKPYPESVAQALALAKPHMAQHKCLELRSYVR